MWHFVFQKQLVQLIAETSNLRKESAMLKASSQEFATKFDIYPEGKKRLLLTTASQETSANAAHPSPIIVRKSERNRSEDIPDISQLL